MSYNPYFRPQRDRAPGLSPHQFFQPSPHQVPLHVKVLFKDDARRFQCASSYESVSRRISELFGPNVVLKYEDADGDMVSLKCDADLAEAMQVMAVLNEGVLRLRAVEGSQPVAPQASAPVPSIQHVAPSKEEEKQVRKEAKKKEREEKRALKQATVEFQADQAPATMSAIAAMLDERAPRFADNLVKSLIAALPASAATKSFPTLPVHHGVVCNACRRTITGFRYKCTVCHDFDLCAACEDQRTPVGLHAPAHVLLKIPVPTQVDVTLAPPIASAEIDRTVVRHPHVTCDGCKGEIFGVRYKCGNCQDFDLCETCEAAGIHRENDHLFIKVRKPLVSYFPRHAPVLPALPTAAPRQGRGFPQPQGTYTNLCREIRQGRVFSARQKDCCAASTPVASMDGLAAATQRQCTQPAERVQESTNVAAPAPVPVPASTTVPAASTPTEPSELRAVYLADVTYFDDEVVQPGHIEKKWRMRNPGPTSWPADTKLQFVHGNLLADESQFDVAPLAANEEGVISASLNVPSTPGRYMSVWQLTSNGIAFGHRIWCAVVVRRDPSPARTAPTTVALTPLSQTPATTIIPESQPIVSSAAAEPAPVPATSASPSEDFVMVEYEDPAEPEIVIAADLAESMMSATMYQSITELAQPLETAEQVAKKAEEEAERMRLIEAKAKQEAEDARLAEVETKKREELIRREQAAVQEMVRKDAEETARLAAQAAVASARVPPSSPYAANPTAYAGVNQLVAAYSPRPQPVLSTHDANIQTLMGMGFYDRARISKLLYNNNENIEATVNALLRDADDSWAGDDSWATHRH